MPYVPIPKEGFLLKKYYIRFCAFFLGVILAVSMVPHRGLASNQTTEVPESSPVVTKEAILSALYEADIATLREAISVGLISCEELTAYYLERINAYNGPYNCFITICSNAMDVARERDQRIACGEADGILFGIPIVVKDNIDFAGFHTTNGHKKTEEQIAKNHASIVNYLLAQGAVVIGKTNMSTDAQDARRSFSEAAGETKNAYSCFRFLEFCGRRTWHRHKLLPTPAGCAEWLYFPSFRIEENLDEWHYTIECKPGCSRCHHPYCVRSGASS